MALIQRYTTEFSGTAEANRRSRFDALNQQLASLKRNDDDEKRYLKSLNDRLQNLLGSLSHLELINKKLRDELNTIVIHWDLTEERRRLMEELETTTRQLSIQHRQKVFAEAEAKVFNEQTHLTDRVTAVLIDALHFYTDQIDIFQDLIHELEIEYQQIQRRLTWSSAQVQSVDDEYQKELSKFHSFLAEWSKLALEKNILVNEIQSLRERFNFRSACNQEELNEWKRLLTRISHDSKNFYRDYLDTVKQQIRMDYQQMAKDQQKDLDLQLSTRLKEIEEQLTLKVDVHDEQQRRDQLQRLETRLQDNTKEFERLQNTYRNLEDENQRKRNILRDLENEANRKRRQHDEQNARLERETDLTRAEYQRLRDQLDQLARQLKFSVEEELRIYETLLNSLHQKQKNEPVPDNHLTTSIIEDSTRHRSVPSGSFDTTAIGRVTGDLFGIEQNRIGRNQKRTTTRTTRRIGQEQQDQQRIQKTIRRIQQSLPELDENYMQRKIHITRKYKGNILIKFVDVAGRFVEIENTGNQTRDLTGWYVERSIDGQRLRYQFPSFELESHQSVRIFGNEYQHTSFSMEDSARKLIAPNFQDWGIGRKMRTELFNRDNVAKALFEQTIKD